MKFDSYSASAPHESDPWSSTDRGWLYDTFEGVDSIGVAYSGTITVGNYLDYGPCRQGENQSEGWVHVVYHGRFVDPNKHPEFWRPGVHKSRYCQTVDAAKAWLIEMHTGQKGLL